MEWNHPKDVGGGTCKPLLHQPSPGRGGQQTGVPAPCGQIQKQGGHLRGWAEHRQLLPILFIRQVSSPPRWEWETCGERPGVTVRLMGGLSVCAKRPEEKEAAGSRQKATQLSFLTNLPLLCFFLCYPPRPPSLLWWAQLTGYHATENVGPWGHWDLFILECE